MYFLHGLVHLLPLVGKKIDIIKSFVLLTNKILPRFLKTPVFVKFEEETSNITIDTQNTIDYLNQNLSTEIKSVPRLEVSRSITLDESGRVVWSSQEVLQGKNFNLAFELWETPLGYKIIAGVHGMQATTRRIRDAIQYKKTQSKQIVLFGNLPISQVEKGTLCNSRIECGHFTENITFDRDITLTGAKLKVENGRLELVIPFDNYGNDVSSDDDDKGTFCKKMNTLDVPNKS